MAKFRKRPVVVEATQWFKNGDHPEDVRRYRRLGSHDTTPCQHCGKPVRDHGWLATLEGGHIVCPGDWIITGVEDEMYPCKPSIFEATYEAVTEEGQDDASGE